MRITVPLSVPGLAATTILCFILSWNDVFFALILTRTNALTPAATVKVVARRKDRPHVIVRPRSTRVAGWGPPLRLLLAVAGIAGLALGGIGVPSAAATAGRVRSGTGFFVSADGFLMTSAHVVAGCRDIAVWEPGRVERPGYVMASDRRRDLSLLRVDGATPRLVPPIAAAPAYAGERLFTMGYGVISDRPLRPVLTQGPLLGDGRAQSGNPILLIRARLRAGNSGGAVLDGEGSLRGMVIGRDEDHPEFGVAVPGEDITAWLAARGITLPRHAAAVSIEDFLGAISVLIQCTP